MKIVLLKYEIIILIFLTVAAVLCAQTENDFPAGNYWSLNAGIGITNFGVQGMPVQLVIDPKLWLSPKLIVGSKAGITYSVERHDSQNILSNILTLEGQVYLRWNFMHLGEQWDKKTDLFVQGGLGLIAAYRGEDNPFDDVRETRGSILLDAALGATIPLRPRWHIEPSVRFGYPHIFGISVTAGYKFPLPQSSIIERLRTEYVETVRTLPPNEIVRRITIPAIEFVIFGPDIGSYNVGIDRDAQQLNELVMNGTAQMLIKSPDLRVRIEGHANPFTINKSEADDLMALSSMRANVVAEQLRIRGVSDEQMVIIAFGGTRNATSEWDIRNRNRRVELMIIQYDAE